MNLLRQLIPIAAVAGWLTCTAFATTPGSLDTTFDTGAGVAPGSYSDVEITGDGKALVLGGNGSAAKLLRVNTDGSVDRAFAARAIEGAHRVALQSDGKIVLAGQFTSYAGTARQSILRLNPDGTLDTTWNPGAGLQRETDFQPVDIYQVAVQPDGKVVAAGVFRYTGKAGVSRTKLVRFNANGSIDTTFDPEIDLSGFGLTIRALGVGSAGQVFVHYWRMTAEFQPIFDTVRLTNTGAIDPAFDDGSGPTELREGSDYPSEVTILDVQGDGSILLGGNFNKYNGVMRSGLVRLLPTGAVDADFEPVGFRYVFTATGSQELNGMGRVDTLVSVGGQILVGGLFNRIGTIGGAGIVRQGIARLNANGSLDETFDPVGGFESVGGPNVRGLAVRAGSGEIVAVGSSSSFNGTRIPGVAQLSGSGALDTSFLANTVRGFDEPPLRVVALGDGRVLVGGGFDYVNGELHPSLVRLLADGSLDPTFAVQLVGTLAGGAPHFAQVDHLIVQADGRILVAGMFNKVNGVERYGLARLEANGALDLTFDPGVFHHDSRQTNLGNIRRLALWNDPANPLAPERIVAVGNFTHHAYRVYDAGGGFSDTVTPRAGIARLLADGSFDSSFDPGTGFRGSDSSPADIWDAAVASDGKIIVAGTRHSTFNGAPAPAIVRLLGNGTRDTSFDATAAVGNRLVSSVLALRDDGKVMVGGLLTGTDGVMRNTIVRLNADGGNDASFDAGAGFHDQFLGAISDLVLQANGGVIAAGQFRTFRDVGRSGIARIKVDGTLDTTFNPGTGFTDLNFVSDLALQADGKIIALGSFDRYDGTVRHYLARIHGGPGGGEDPDPDLEESNLRLTGTATSPVDPTGATTRPGELMTYTLNYQNMGDEGVTDAVITVPVPQGTSFKPAKPKDGSRLVTRKVNGTSVKHVEWRIGTLAPGAGGTVSFQVLVSKQAEVKSIIRVRDSEISSKRNGAPLEPSNGSRIDSEVMSLLNVTSTTITTEVGHGGLITYKFAVRNDGSTPMTAVQLRYVTEFGSGVMSAFFTDASGLEIGSPTKAPGGAFNPNVDEIGSAVTWYFGKISAHSTGYAKLTVRVWYDRAANSELAGGELAGSYRVSGKSGTAPRVFPATMATTGPAATERPYIGLSKTVEELPLVTDPTVGEVAATNVGDKFTFALWAYNIGERTADRAFIQERAPEYTVIDPGSVLINGVKPAKTVAVTDKGRTMLVPIGDLPVGATVKLSYRVRVQPREDRAVNHFLVSEGGYIGTASLGETVHAYPDPLLVKVVAPATFSASTEEMPARAEIGQVVQHFIRFQNNNNRPAKNARITNPIPPGAKFRGSAYVEKVNESYVDAGSTRNGVPITQPALDATSGNIVFPLGNLEAGEAVTVRVDLEKTAQVLELNPPELVNVARMEFGPERNAQREAVAGEFNPNPFTLPPYAVAIGRTPVLHASVPRFFLGMMAPAAVREGQEFQYAGFYGNMGSVAGTATINLSVPPETATLVGVNVEDGRREDPTVLVNDDGKGNVIITAQVPAHTSLKFQLRCIPVVGKAGEVIVSSRHRISGDGFSFVTAGKPLATYIYSAEAGFDENTARSAVETALLDAAGINFAYGRDDSIFRDELRQLNARTISTILVGADVIPLKNGVFVVPLGGNQVLAGAAGIISNDGASIISNDGASIISNDGASIISNDGASIISGGAGNIQFHGLPGFAGSPTAAALLSDPKQIVNNRAGNLLNLGGHNLFGGINGTALVNNASGGSANADYFRATSANIISGGAGNVIGQDGAGIISGGAGNIHVMGAGNIISGGGGNILGDQGSGIISNDGATLTTSAGGNIISGGGGNIISGGAGN